jgi:hypothetical protein
LFIQRTRYVAPFRLTSGKGYIDWHGLQLLQLLQWLQWLQWFRLLQALQQLQPLQQLQIGAAAGARKYEKER